MGEPGIASQMECQTTSCFISRNVLYKGKKLCNHLKLVIFSEARGSMLFSLTSFPRLSSGYMVFIALPAIWRSHLESKHFSRCSCTPRRPPGLLHELALLQPQHLLSASWASSSSRNPSSGWNVSFHRRTRSLHTLQSHFPCKRPIRAFRNMGAFCTLS